MQTISAADFQKMYGAQGLAKFSAPPQASAPSAGSDISAAFQGGVSQFNKGRQQAATATNPLQTLEGGLNELAGGVGVVSSPLAPVTKYIGQGIDYAADKISNNKSLQDFATTKAGENTARAAEDVGNTANLLGVVAGGEGTPSLVKGAANTAKNVGENLGTGMGKTGAYMGTAAKDIIPTTQGVINHQVMKALDLTPGDINNISRSTGNDVGKWISDNNLIGKNKAETQANLENFYKQNYNSVRSEIEKVPTIYKQSQVPRFIDALKQINSKIENAPGLEKTWAEVQNLIGKKEVSLSDVQRAKELLDEHFNLYKVTGDVGEGVAKEGLANIRGELRSFIEKEVEKTTGADIHGMNNNVSTAKSLGNAITTRAPKGLTASNLKLGDLGIFGMGMSFGGPLAGAALVFGKKLMETPTVRLRVARYLDQVSDAKKAKIQADMQAGKIPSEFSQFIKKPANSNL